LLVNKKQLADTSSGTELITAIGLVRACRSGRKYVVHPWPELPKHSFLRPLQNIAPKLGWQRPVTTNCPPSVLAFKHGNIRLAVKLSHCRSYREPFNEMDDVFEEILSSKQPDGDL